MDLTQISEKDFICESNLSRAPANPSSFDNVRDILQSMIGAHVKTLGNGYEIFEVLNQSEDLILVFNGAAVGCYFGELLAIDSPHKGKALSVPLILAACPRRNLPTSRKVSEPGEAALRKAWRVANSLETNPWP